MNIYIYIVHTSGQVQSLFIAFVNPFLLSLKNISSSGYLLWSPLKDKRKFSKKKKGITTKQLI